MVKRERGGIPGLYYATAVLMGVPLTLVAAVLGFSSMESSVVALTWLRLWEQLLGLSLSEWGVTAILSNLFIAWAFRDSIADGWTNWTRFFLAIFIGYAHVALYCFVVTLPSWPGAGGFLGLYYGFKIAPALIPMCLAAYWIMRWADKNDRNPRVQRRTREAPVL